MKSTELRIGNYVWDDYCGNMIIHQISNDLVDCKKENHLPSGRYDLNSIKPIVLDGNWLLKFGFVKSKTDMTFYKGDFEIFLPNFFLYKSSALSGIKHVHQLQNLHHALTGTELILK